MAANTYGISTVAFGSPVITGYITKSSTLDQSCNVNVLIENETGSIVSRRYDDIVTKVSFDGYYNSTGSIVTPGSEFTYSSSLYNSKFICEKSTIKYENKGFTQFTIEGVTSQYLPLP